MTNRSWAKVLLAIAVVSLIGVGAICERALVFDEHRFYTANLKDVR
jgi:hypothetical protein